MRIPAKVIGALLALGLSFSAHAEGLGVNLRVGNLGVGVEAVLGLNRYFNVRFGINDLLYINYDRGEAGLDYDILYEVQSYSALIDVHPFTGLFRLTAGLIVNNNTWELTGRFQNQDALIGGTMYTPAQIGSLEGEIRFSKYLPYVGVGVGNAAGKTKWRSKDGVRFFLEAGIMVQYGREVELRAGPAVSQADLDFEAHQIDQSLDHLFFSRFHPIVALGIGYQFY